MREYQLDLPTQPETGVVSATENLWASMCNALVRCIVTLWSYWTQRFVRNLRRRTRGLLLVRPAGHPQPLPVRILTPLERRDRRRRRIISGGAGRSVTDIARRAGPVPEFLS
ncbi:hypothetical protein NITMOv2_4171 [Nitrospira moscoviensis]|uniref:Uncharacterized protein n=1 Tax=Nitrospira moscoviensis TaxID=42253 RepID=A0A0K2GHZ3_NITMO|nr:hypothetical protein NITMOv2_4171 [Nitrospira moscoviensis]